MALTFCEVLATHAASQAAGYWCRRGPYRYQYNVRRGRRDCAPTPPGAIAHRWPRMRWRQSHSIPRLPSPAALSGTKERQCDRPRALREVMETLAGDVDAFCLVEFTQVVENSLRAMFEKLGNIVTRTVELQGEDELCEEELSFFSDAVVIIGTDRHWATVEWWEMKQKLEELIEDVGTIDLTYHPRDYEENNIWDDENDPMAYFPRSGITQW